MRLRFDSLFIGASAALVITLGTTGCARRVAEAPPEPPAPPPAETSAPLETAPPVIEAPPPMVAPPDIDPAFFEFDSYMLNESAQRALDRAAEVLREQPDFEVTIEGHCDERGTTEYNLSLGEQRARAARSYLVAAGVAEARMQIISYGEEMPFDRGHDEAAWAMNRRAHFVVRQTMLDGPPTSDALH